MSQATLGDGLGLTFQQVQRTIGGALGQPIGQPVAGPELLDQAREVVTALPAACRALDPQHVELAD